MLWYVMLGSAIGGGARYLLGTFIQQRSAGAFPLGTLVINVAGSFVLAVILRYAMDASLIRPEVRAFLTTGVCGGFTTFSAFGWETVKLMQDGDYHRAAWYVGLSVVLTVGAAFLGLAFAHQVLELRRRL